MTYLVQTHEQNGQTTAIVIAAVVDSTAVAHFEQAGFQHTTEEQLYRLIETMQPSTSGTEQE